MDNDDRDRSSFRRKRSAQSKTIYLKAPILERQQSKIHRNRISSFRNSIDLKNDHSYRKDSKNSLSCESIASLSPQKKGKSQKNVHQNIQNFSVNDILGKYEDIMNDSKFNQAEQQQLEQIILNKIVDQYKDQNANDSQQYSSSSKSQSLVSESSDDESQLSEEIRSINTKLSHKNSIKQTPNKEPLSPTSPLSLSLKRQDSFNYNLENRVRLRFQPSDIREINSSSIKNIYLQFYQMKKVSQEAKMYNLSVKINQQESYDNLKSKYDRNFQKPSKSYPILLTKEVGIAKIKWRYVHTFCYYFQFNYHDEYPLLEFRKILYLVISVINKIVKSITISIFYQIYISFIIIVNIILYIISKLLVYDYNYYCTSNTYIIYFLVLLKIYIIDFVFQISAKGIFRDNVSFFKRLVELTLIFLYDYHLSSPKYFFDVTPFRAFLLLITLSSLQKGLRKMINAMVASLSHMIEPTIFVLLSCLIFASIGQSLFKGLFNQRCDNDLSEWVQCNQGYCSEGQCIMSDESVQIPINYNNMVYSFGQILRVGTMDGWTFAMDFTIRAFHPQIWLLYIPIIIIAGFFNFNLPVAVFKCLYSEYEEEEIKQKKQVQCSLQQLKYIGFYDMLKTIQNFVQDKTMYRNFRSSTQRLTRKTVINLSQPRILSKQMMEKTKISFINQIKNRFESYSIQNILLPKYRDIANRFQKIDFKNYTQDQDFITILRQYCKANVVLTKTVDYKHDYTSSSQYEVRARIFLPLLKQREQQQQKFRQTKLKSIFRVKQGELELKKMHGKLKVNKYYLPVLVRTKTLTINTSNTKRTNYEQIKTPDGCHTPEKINFINKLFKQQTLQDEQDASQSPKAFSIRQEGQVLIYLNNRYQCYEEVEKKIKQKVAPLVKFPNLQQFSQLYSQIRMNDLAKNSIKSKNWSGKDVLKTRINGVIKQVHIFKSLNRRNIDIWLTDFFGILRIWRKYCYFFITSKIGILFFDLIIFLNTLFISLSGFIDRNLINTIEDMATIILAVEIFLKLFVYKPRRVIKDRSFLFENLIILLSVIELSFSGQLNLTIQYKSLIRATKVFLFYRCIMYIQIAKVIAAIASITYESYIYLVFLMFFMVFNCGLIGMELYSNEFQEFQQTGYQQNFDDPLKAFMNIFNIMLNDDWYGVFTIGSYRHQIGSIIFSYGMVFGLNYFTYGIFLALLLDGFQQYFEREFQNESNQYINDKVTDHKRVQQQITQIEHQSNTELNDPVSSSSSDEEIKRISMQVKKIQIIDPSLRRESVVGNIFKKRFSAFQKSEINNIKQDEKNLRDQLNKNNYKSDVSKALRNMRDSIFQIQADLVQKSIKLYDGIDCTNSLFIFDKSNRFRRFCYRISITNYLNYAYIMLIIFQIAILSFEYNQVYIQLAINLLFLSEMIIKVISQGAVLDNGRYFNNLWKVLELVYQITYYIHIISGVQNQAVSSLLSFVFLRPIQLFYEIKLISNLTACLAKSLFDIINICIVILLAWVVFAIFGVIIYSEKFGYCELEYNFDVNEQQCLANNQTWYNYKHNFDNIAQAMMTLYQISTFDGIAETLWLAQNSRGSNYGPHPYSNQIPTYVFMISFCTIGTMFFLNFFTGILYISIEAHNKKLIDKKFSQQQEEFRTISNIILKERLVLPHIPTDLLTKSAWNITNDYVVQLGMYLLLIFNSIIIMMYIHQANDKYLDTLNILHHCCTVVFVFWVILQFASHGFQRYFDNFWRIYYVIVIIEGLIDLIYDYSNNWFQLYKLSNQTTQSYQGFRILYMLRNIRIIIVFQGLVKVQRLLRVMSFALPYMTKIFFILIVVMIVYAFFGVYLFQNVDKGAAYDDVMNFSDFGHAMLVMIKCVTQDDCRTMMTDSMKYNPYCQDDPKYCGTSYAPIYFFSLQFITNQILLNTFVLSMVSQFENFFNNQDSVLQTYVENIDKIKNVWIKYANSDGKHMKIKFISYFLLEIGLPLGSHSNDNIWDSAKYAEQFQIRANHKDEIPYNQLVYELFRIRYKNIVFKQGNEECQKQMKEFGKEMRFRLIYSRSDKWEKRNNIGPQLNLKGNINVLSLQISALLVFKAWQANTQQILEQLQNNDLPPENMHSEQSFGAQLVRRQSISIQSQDQSKEEEINQPIYFKQRQTNRKRVSLVFEKNDYDLGDKLKPRQKTIKHQQSTTVHDSQESQDLLISKTRIKRGHNNAQNEQLESSRHKLQRKQSNEQNQEKKHKYTKKASLQVDAPDDFEKRRLQQRKQSNIVLTRIEESRSRLQKKDSFEQSDGFKNSSIQRKPSVNDLLDQLQRSRLLRLRSNSIHDLDQADAHAQQVRQFKIQ